MEIKGKLGNETLTLDIDSIDIDPNKIYKVFVKFDTDVSISDIQRSLCKLREVMRMFGINTGNLIFIPVNHGIREITFEEDTIND